MKKRYEVRLTNKMDNTQYAIKDLEKDCIILGKDEVIDELNNLDSKNKELQEEIEELEEICEEYSKFRIFYLKKINRIYDILTKGGD